MRIVICGSRSLINYQEFRDTVSLFLNQLVSTLDTSKEQIIIVSGAARGVDSMAECYAQENSLALERYPADWKTHGKRAGMIRNHQMLKIADLVIAFWDGSSPGTKHMIDQCNSKNIPIMTFEF